MASSSDIYVPCKAVRSNRRGRVRLELADRPKAAEATFLGWTCRRDQSSDQIKSSYYCRQEPTLWCVAAHWLVQGSRLGRQGHRLHASQPKGLLSLMQCLHAIFARSCMCLVTLQLSCCPAALQHPAAPLAPQAPSDKSVDGERGRRLILDGPRVPQASALYAIMYRLTPAGALRGACKALDAWHKPSHSPPCHFCVCIVYAHTMDPGGSASWSYLVRCVCFDTCLLTRVVGRCVRVCHRRAPRHDCRPLCQMLALRQSCSKLALLADRNDGACCLGRQTCTALLTADSPSHCHDLPVRDT